MVNIYNDVKNEVAERMAFDLLQEYGISAKKINPGNMIDVMLMLENDLKVDVEFVEKFSKCGELTIDFISSYENETSQPSTVKETTSLLEKFSVKEKIQIHKKGKHFESDNFDYLMVFFYDHFIDLSEYCRRTKPSKQEKILPDYSLIIKTEELVKYVNEHSDEFIDRIERKEKTGNPLINKTDSALITIPIKKLRKETNCLFYKELAIDQDEVLDYLEI